MDRLLEFVINHYILVSAFFILWAVFFSLESKRGGQTVSPQQATNMVNREDARVVDLRDADDFSLPEASFEAAPAAAAPRDSVLADPLEEVEQYLAFERYPQAAGFLTKSIAANPDRADLRLKLLEVYAHLDDHAR